MDGDEIEIEALLEDGTELPSQLVEWLEIELPLLTALLKQMRIPACERCGRRFLPSVRSVPRYCSRDCDRNETTPGRAAPNGRSAREGELVTPFGS